jgi:hypothetical protein
MVRLRSDRWYSRSGQRQISSQQKTGARGFRRLISLVLLLIMVIWVMKKSAEPEVFDRVFRQLGIPLDAKSESPRPFRSHSNIQNAKSVVTSDSAKSDPTAASVASSSFFEGVWDTLAWTSKDFRQATEMAFKPRSLSPDATVEAGSIPQSQASDFTWSSPDIQLAVEIALSENPQEFSLWLDRRLLQDLTDGSPWRGSENAAFFRLLQKTSQGPGAEAELLRVTSYPSLKESLTQGRGTSWIRFRGTVERIKCIELAKPQLQIERYWTAWLRPSDRSPYPVVVYLTRLPEEVKEKGLDEIKGEMEVFALPAKLVAYNAVGGVELAPALCGIASDYWVHDVGFKNANESAARNPSDGLWAVGIAACLASLAVIWIWNRTRKSQVLDNESAEPAKKDSKRLKFQLGKGKSSSGTALGLMWILGFSLASDSSLNAMMPLAPQAAAAGEQATGDTVFSLIDARLSLESLAEIKSYSANESLETVVFPNSLGRVMFLMDQLGWPQIRESSEHPSKSTANWSVSAWTGWVVGCDIIQLNPMQKEWMEQSIVYRLHVQIDGPERSSSKGFLYVRRAPSQWLKQAALNQPFKADLIEFTESGELSKSQSITNQAAEGKEVSSPPEKIGITNEIQWTSGGERNLDSISPEIPSDWKRLLLYGSDLTWIDKASMRQNLGLSFSDRDSFYSLLRIATQVAQDGNGSPLGPVNWAKLPETELLTKAQATWIGRGIEVKGRIARITRVSIDNADSQKLAGADCYYELDGFVRIEGKRIVVAAPKIAAQNTKELTDEQVRTDELVYENEFPFTVVTLKLPEFLKAGLIDRDGVEHQSWELQRWVDVRGFYFRNWSYRSEFVSGKSSRERQMAPLIVASELLPTEFDFPINTSPSQYLSWGIVVAILFLTFVCSRFILSDRLSKTRKRNRLT